MKTHLDWAVYETYGAGNAYAGIPATGGNYTKAVRLYEQPPVPARRQGRHVPKLPYHARSATVDWDPGRGGGAPLVGLEPSCLLALRDEFYSLSLGLDVVQLGKQAFLSEEFLMREGVPAWIVYASCCGMSGGFGLESEHYEASRQMGELALLPAVRAVPAKASIVADGFSCRHQIKDGSGREAIHVAVLLQRALADVA